MLPRSRVRRVRVVVLAAAIGSLGASWRTPNFVVEAPRLETARRIGKAAERHRRVLAVRWLGRPMPRWASPCRVTVRPATGRAAGATTFTFERGHVFGWRMTLRGPLDRVLESILPHEVTHTVLACRFRRPLPRWADEGAAMLAESTAERRRQRELVRDLLARRRQLPLASLVTATDYPHGPDNLVRLYAQGFSLVEFLVSRGGRGRFLEFLDHARSDGWDPALRTDYGLSGIAGLERVWLAWAGADPRGLDRRIVARPAITVRGQTPEPDRRLPRPAAADRYSVPAARRISPPSDLAGWRAPDPRGQPASDAVSPPVPARPVPRDRSPRPERTSDSTERASRLPVSFSP